MTMRNKQERSDQPDQGRRRFARAGAAAPVVLGSLASKPVLGSSVSTYCSVSGQMSGNLSRRLPDEVSCADSGQDLAFWTGDGALWPESKISRGTADTNGKVTGGTSFNGFTVDNTSLAGVFFVSGGKLVGAPKGNSEATPATMWDVLTLSPQNNGGISADLHSLGKATVISLLNAFTYTGYPVWPERIATMFNATWNGGAYVVGGFHWSQLKVTSYLESLYQG